MNHPFIDALTGLPGRETLESFRKEFSNRPENETWTVIMIDVDHFKLINDIYGHLTGDQVLREVASILEANLRNMDVMIRFGGDEFLGVFPNTDKDRALNYAERVMEAIRPASFARDLKFSLSMGLADSKDSDNNLDAVIKRADKALYQAKESGRGRISFSTDTPESVIDGKVQLSHFVGRQSELRQLRQLLDESVTEGARFALIQGDAGVGKSRLAAELKHFAKFKNCLIVNCECFEFGEPEPYAFFMTPIRNLLNTFTTDLIEKVRVDAEPFHPATAEFLPDLGARISDDIQFFREERLKFRIFDDITRITSALARIAPCLIIIDDIQWINEPDLELLSFLVRSALKDRIFYISTMRTLEKSVPRIKRHLLSLRRAIPLLALDLSNLEEHEASNLIMFALKDPNIPREVLDAVFKQSGGNPFFLEELLNSLIQAGNISRHPSGHWSYQEIHDFHLPDSLAQLISSRLYPLEEVSRKLLRIAALTSGIFSLDLLSSVAEVSTLEIAEALEKPLLLGLVVSEETQVPPSYRFIHDTVRSFLHRELSAGMKAIYHVRMAEYYDEKYTSTGREDFIIPMAYHYCRSNAGEKARNSAFLAAKLSEKRKASRESIRWFETFMDFDDSISVDEADMFTAHKMLGSLYSITGEGEQANAQFDAAMKIVKTHDDRVLMLRKKAINFHNMSRFRESRDYYGEALDLTEQPRVRIGIKNALAFLDYIEGKLDKAQEKISEVETMLKNITTEDDTLDRNWASFFTTKGVIQSAIHPDQEAADYYEKALALFIKHGDTMGESTIYNNLAGIYPRSGNYEKTIEVLKRAEEINSRLDDALNLSIVYFNTALIYTEINQPMMAREYLQKYRDLNDSIHNDLGAGYERLGMASVCEEEGDYTRVEECYREALETFSRLGNKGPEFECILGLVQVMTLTNRCEEAGRLLEKNESEIKMSLIKTIQTEYQFTKGLLALRISEGPEGLETAVGHFTDALKTQEITELSILMRWYYFLAETWQRLDRTDRFQATVTRALEILDARLSNVKKSMIRKNICSSRYTRALLDMNFPVDLD